MHDLIIFGGGVFVGAVAVGLYYPYVVKDANRRIEHANQVLEKANELLDESSNKEAEMETHDHLDLSDKPETP